MPAAVKRRAALPESAKPGARINLDELTIRRIVNSIMDDALAKLRRPQVFVGTCHVRRYSVKAHTRKGYWRSIPARRKGGR